jgi:ribosome biogenesis GTPase / thiamine phosphate phosphatase
MEELEGRVVRSQSGFVWVLTDRGLVQCTLRGRLKKERKARTDLAVIGDRVRIVRSEAASDGVIEAIAPRDNRFARRQPGGRGAYKEDVLVANLDRLFIVLACANPRPNPRLLDRFLVVAELDAIPTAIVLNKADQLEEAPPLAAYEALGYPLFLTSATQGSGVDALRDALAGKVNAFVGPSGVGKSSLLNAVDPALGVAVGTLRDAGGKGRHTTRVAELHAIGNGGFVADTPGIRELAAFDVPARELPRCFPEMRPHLGQCRFPDCTHAHEPDCAVRDALAAGQISSERYDSYLRILRNEDR